MIEKISIYRNAGQLLICKLYFIKSRTVLNDQDHRNFSAWKMIKHKIELDFKR